jgi:hypothetical protein
MMVRLAILIALLGGAAFPQTLTFTSPTCGGSVAGTIELAAKSVAGVARVDYRMGSLDIGSSLSPVTWNTAWAMDGASEIEATAYNAAGAAVAGGSCLVTISNHQVTLNVNSPDLTKPLSGVVTMPVTGSDAAAFPAIWTLNIDGEQQSIVWTDNSWVSPNTVTFTLDTTRFTNGLHELHISMNSRTGPTNPQWVNWRGMVNRVVQFSNGRVTMDIVPSVQSLFLKPGGKYALGCVQLMTDGTSTSCASPVFTPADDTVVTADSSGNITALKDGFTLVNLQVGTYSTAARVWVAANMDSPHFGGNGALLSTYEAGKSLFVIAPFFLDPTALTATSALLTEVPQSGVNTLSFGMYLNPWNTTTPFTTWQTNFEQAIGQKMDWAAANGYHMLLTGDDIFRRIGGDAWYTLNWPSGQQAVQYATHRLAATGVGIGLEGIDEASAIWGDRPVPNGHVGAASYLFNSVTCQAGACSVDWLQNPLPGGWPFAFAGPTALQTPVGSLYQAQNTTANGFQFQATTKATGTYTAANAPSLEYLWFAGDYCGQSRPCVPEVPNNALLTMSTWIRSQTPAVPLSFPSLADEPASVDGNWMGPVGISDYASNYFTSLKTRTTYPWTEGIQEMSSSMENEFLSRQPLYMLNRPQLMLVSLAGASYTKASAGTATYEPGTDQLSEPGVSPAHVTAMMMQAAALGGAGLRLYYFETPGDLSSRAATPVGSQLQTGANPVNLQTAQWQAMSAAANLLNTTLGPYLLSLRMNSPAYGRNITTAARDAANGQMLLIVNGNDWPRTIPVAFAPYSLGYGAKRYWLHTFGVSFDALPATQTSDSITLAAGESVAYVFPRSK